MCIAALKDLDKSSVRAIMELAFPSTQNPHIEPSYLQTMSRSRSLPTMSPASDSSRHSGRHITRSASGDYGSSMIDVSARARSEMYGDILDAEEEALGLSPSIQVG